MDRFFRHTQRFQRRLSLVHHRRRAADEGFIVLAEIHQRFCQRLELFPVNTAMEQIAVERLLAEDGDQLQTLRVFIFQVRQRPAEHHALAAAVAVNQGEVAVGFSGQRSGHNRQHRGDPGPGGNRQIVAFAFGLRLVAKMPLGHHHLQCHARFDFVPGIAGKTSALDGFDRHADLTARGAPADGVAAAQFIPARTGFQGQMLTGTEAVRLL